MNVATSTVADGVASEPNLLVEALRKRLNPDVQIDIYRHGNAVAQKDAPGQSEIQRHLTAKGREQVLALGQKIADIPFDLVVTSPAVRAIHTALKAITESRPAVTMPFYVATGVQFYMPAQKAHFDEVFRLIGELKHSRYGGYKAVDTMCLWQTFQVEILEAMLAVPNLEAARRVFLSNHGMIGSCLGEIFLEVLAGEVDTASRELLHETTAAECSCFEVTRAGVKYIDYLAA